MIGLSQGFLTPGNVKTTARPEGAEENLFWVIV
jgi:hypothetical protein